MISVPVHNQAGAEVGRYEFDPDALATTINKQLLHDVVVMYEANRRAGTAVTRSRGMVAGSTRKLYRQKGSGRARAGALRSPVRRGGGHAFARKVRDFSYRLPRKAVQKATRMALLSKFQDDQATVLDELSVETPQTKAIAALLGALALDQTSCLLAIERRDPVVWKSARNIPSLQVTPVSDLNARDVLRQQRLLVTRAGLDRLLGGNNGRRE